MRVDIRAMLKVRKGDDLVIARQITEVLHDLLHRAIRGANKTQGKQKAYTGQHGSEKRATMLALHTRFTMAYLQYTHISGILQEQATTRLCIASQRSRTVAFSFCDSAIEKEPSNKAT